jgi:hypothetical protein
LEELYERSQILPKLEKLFSSSSHDVDDDDDDANEDNKDDDVYACSCEYSPNILV